MCMNRDTYSNRDIHTYLQTIHKLRQENSHDLIYTDETWVNAHHTNEYLWIDSDGEGGWNVPSEKRLYCMLVEGADLVFRSKTNSADYHDEMNSEHYMEWLTEQLLPGLEEPTVIIWIMQQTKRQSPHHKLKNGLTNITYHTIKRQHYWNW